MENLNTLFRQRIGMLTHETLQFNKLDVFLEQIAREIPFENLCVIDNSARNITKENLINKIITKNEGGLCYELNTILHLFLIENGFTSTLVRGRTYDHNEKQWSAAGKTHILNLITHEDQQYVVDTGFGANLPLRPIPLSGSVVESHNGEFRVEKNRSKDGEYFLHMRLKHRQEDWKLGYIFDSTEEVKDFSVLNEVQKLIIEHPESRFNKKPLVTKINERGIIILTNTSFIELNNGKETKKAIDDTIFKKMLINEFNIRTFGNFSSKLEFN